MFFTKSVFFCTKKDIFCFSNISRKSCELKFGEQVSFREPVLNFEKSDVDFQYFGLFPSKTVKISSDSMEN